MLKSYVTLSELELKTHDIKRIQCKKNTSYKHFKSFSTLLRFRKKKELKILSCFFVYLLVRFMI
jgi:hypothetical protein